MTDPGADEVVGEIEHASEAFRAEGRASLGVTGRDEAVGSFFGELRANKVGVYPLGALGVLAIVDKFQAYAFGVLAPEISRTLGVGKGAIAGVIAVATLTTTISPLPVAALVQRRPRRALLIVGTGIAWSLVAICTGFVTAMLGLVLVVAIDGLTTGGVLALHPPMLLDSYPPTVRVRALSFYEAMDVFGLVVSPLLVAILATWFHLTWRGVFVVLGLVSLAGALSALRLRDPGFGRWDTERIRSAVRGDDVVATVTDGLTDDDVALGFFEVVRRLLLIPTIRRLAIGYGVVGVLTVPLATFLAFYFDERWNLGPGARGVFSAVRAAAAVVVLIAMSKRNERLYRASPQRLLALAGVSLAVGIVVLAIAVVVPFLPAVIALFMVALSMFVVINPMLDVVTLSVMPARMRPHAAALIGIFISVGGLAGALFLGGIDRRFGIGGTLVSLVVPGVIGALIIASAGRLVVADMDRMIDETVEEEEIRKLTRTGAHLPMLATRGIDFSYGQVQVLFDVDFTVDDGEMVALLGTNGAGKSTLLKVISGIGLPSAGSVRYRGADITYLDAERRLRLGITQIPGGRAVFGPMTVAENLRVFGHTIRRDRRAVDAAIERSFATFPRLAERRNQKAVTLSGGEQQMLGLAKALLLRPRLLLVDELSLGLAPIIVGQLLDMVREINRDGTAVVLVEQSVNIALGLVDHAYFMEKGQIRFDGPSRELLERGDLLRAVFLDGAGGRAETSVKR